MSTTETDLARNLTALVSAVPGVSTVYALAAPLATIATAAAAIVPGVEASPRPEVVLDENATWVKVSVGITDTAPARTVVRDVHAVIDAHLREVRPEMTPHIGVTIARIG